MMKGDAPTTITSLNNVKPFKPMLLANFSKPFSIDLTPTTVLVRTGKKTPKMMMKIFGNSPIPNHKIDNGIHAMGGIGLTISTIGSTNDLAFSDQPISNPKDTAIAEPIPNPKNTRNNDIWICFSNSPEINSLRKAWPIDSGDGKMTGLNIRR
jgi:hypothetical protein